MFRAVVVVWRRPVCQTRKWVSVSVLFYCWTTSPQNKCLMSSSQQGWWVVCFITTHITGLVSLWVVVFIACVLCALLQDLSLQHTTRLVSRRLRYIYVVCELSSLIRYKHCKFYSDHGEMCGCRMQKKLCLVFCCLNTMHERDRHTDRQTDRPQNDNIDSNRHNCFSVLSSNNW